MAANCDGKLITGIPVAILFNHDSHIPLPFFLPPLQPNFPMFPLNNLFSVFTLHDVLTSSVIWDLY